MPRGFAPCKKDLSQPAIEAAFEAAGWTICDTHALGEKAPDMFVSKRGHTIAIEAKTGKKKRKEHQVAWAEDWRGDYLWGSDPMVLLEMAEEKLRVREASC